MLTDTKLKKSLGKKRDAIEIISDSHGLNARISKAGKITFFYRYRWVKEPVQLSIGEYPAMTIAQARERRQVLRGWLTEGFDPREKIRLERQLVVNTLALLLSSAAARSLAVPTIGCISMLRKWPHFATSSGQVLAATRSGARTSVGCVSSPEQ